MRVLFIGAGSVGGLFGSLLLDAGVDVSFLVRPNRRTQLQQAGLAIASVPDGPVRRLAVRSVTRDEVSSSDVVVFAVRSPELGAAIEDSQASVGPTTTVLPLLNGMRHLASLTERFGNRVLGGLAVTGTVLDADHIIRRLGNEASITFGELDGRSSVRTNDIAALFKPAAFRTVLSPTITQDMWEKWVFMAAAGAVTVLLGGPVGEVVAATDGLGTIEAIIAEACAVAEGAGHPLRAAAVDRIRMTITQPGSPFTTSMYRDFATGRSTEVEPILGALLNEARIHGVDTPLLASAAVRLRVHEAALEMVR
ncbi:2-dehydropantoate 2-reductase [Curtobacterium sp. UNCCL20]|uniref:ketopantoate reductase family protein n=1 Tax=Curtobacterium sp. UNCCL20 TaxID=1502773 RepID=UPI00088841FF|nr:2-dehydropantoate 2-reductase [Curtobacterium sp. UNCCL20]SDQ13601.1 2-dehydropantoate 2-reductase [Curtobacterium sp. UNCCL20]